jgi:hypothetical protein
VWPGSVFLTRLAQRPRNPNVSYQVVLGTRSLLTQAQLGAVRRAIVARLDDHKLGRVLKPRIESWLEDLDELVDGSGDGAVSLARGRLAGVEPMLVPLDHVGLIRCRGLLCSVAADEHPVFTRLMQSIATASKAPRSGPRR